MDCEDAEGVMAGLFDGAEITQANLCAHFDACSDCRELFANLLLVQSMSRIACHAWGAKQICDTPRALKRGGF
jgi:hypothetical protein